MSAVSAPSSPATTEDPGSTVESRRPVTVQRLIKFFIDWVMVIIVVAMMAYFAITSASFLSFGNLSSLLTQNAMTFIVAAVAGILLMSGYADLSVGSSLAVAGVAAGLAFNAYGIVGGIAVGLVAGLLFGIVNGVLIGGVGLSPIVVTLGGLAGGRAVARYLAPDQVYGFPDGVSRFATGEFLGISYIGWMAVIIGCVCLVVMGALPIGKRIQAIGVNPRAAYLVGLRVKPTVIILYAAVGLAVGVAALLQIARLDSAPSGTLGVGFEVTVLTAILLGGIPFTGGRGSLWRVLLAVWLLAVLQNGLQLLNYGPEIAGMVTGGVLIFAAGLQALRVYADRMTPK